MPDPTMTGRYKIDTSEVQGAHDEMLRTIQDTLGQINQTSSREFSKATRTVRGALMDVAVVAGTVDPALGLVVREMAKMRDVTSPLAKGLLFVEKTVVRFATSGLGIFTIALGAAAYALYRLIAQHIRTKTVSDETAESFARLERITKARTQSFEELNRVLEKSEEKWRDQRFAVELYGETEELATAEAEVARQQRLDFYIAMRKEEEIHKRLAAALAEETLKAEKLRKEYEKFGGLGARPPGPQMDVQVDTTASAAEKAAMALTEQLKVQEKVREELSESTNALNKNANAYTDWSLKVESASETVQQWADFQRDAADGAISAHQEVIKALEAQAAAEREAVDISGRALRNYTQDMAEATERTLQFCKTLATEFAHTIVSVIESAGTFSDVIVQLMKTLMMRLLEFAIAMVIENAAIAIANIQIKTAEGMAVMAVNAGETASEVVGHEAEKSGWWGVLIGIGLAAAAIGMIYALCLPEINRAKKAADDIPKFGRGGIVRAPTLALVGEMGPEVIAPRSDFERLIEPRSGRTDVHLEFNGREFGRMITPWVTKTIKQQVRMQ